MKTRLFFLFSIVYIVFLFQNCSQKEFQSIDPGEKLETLENHLGIDEIDNDCLGTDCHYEVGIIDEEREPPVVVPEPEDEPEPISRQSLGVRRICIAGDIVGHKEMGKTVMASQEVSIKVHKIESGYVAGDVVCEISGAEVKESIKQNGEVVFENCPVDLSEYGHIIEAYDENGRQISGNATGRAQLRTGPSRDLEVVFSFNHFGFSDQAAVDAYFSTDEIFGGIPNGRPRFIARVLSQLYFDEMKRIAEAGGDPNGSQIAELIRQQYLLDSGRPNAALLELFSQHKARFSNADIRGEHKNYCDDTQSPLVVDMRSENLLTTPFYLTPIDAGVDFDIMGVFSAPVPHAVKRISWFQSEKIMPIVLPNKDGQVLGVDQLFGNNTIGPDGEGSFNGFTALAKYDGHQFGSDEVDKEAQDKYITDKDEVYERLKLWTDKNLNGVAESGELLPMSDYISVIDLTYDEKYYMKDKYGNEYKYKSVVKMNSGMLRPVFDIWFRVSN